jgi:glyoxalase superfamily protein
MARSIQVTFDCGDPGALARFWAQALGYVEQQPPQGFSSWPAFLESVGVPESEWESASAVVDPAGRGPRLFFQKVPEGKTAKNRVHIDVNVSTGLEGAEGRAAVEAEAARLVDLGATELRHVDRNGEFWVVLQDPEGNELCLQ